MSSKIEIVCLGGQDEKDKLCTALIVNEDIFVLGCGINCPATVTLGIKKIIADYSYLIDNKHKIRGIFIPTANYNGFGGLEFLIKLLPNVPIYTSFLGKMILNNFFDRRFNLRNKFNLKPQKPVSWNLKVVDPLMPFKCGSLGVMAFRTASYMPTSLGFVFNTDQGAIVFVDQFIIPTRPSFAFTDLIHDINKFTKNNTLCLITSVGENINNPGFTSPNYSVTSFFDNTVLDMPGRGIFAFEEEDIYKLVKLATIAASRTIPFYIYSGSLAKTFNYMLNNKIINIPNLMYIKEDQINQIEKCIVVVSGDKQSLFTKLQKIVVGDDRRLEFKPTDTFVYSMLTQPGYEKLEADLFDNLNRLQVHNTIRLPKNIIQLSQSQEDHKFLINVIKPKYLIPVNGLYMDFIKYKGLSKYVNIPSKNFIIKDNGQFITFENGKNVENGHKRIKVIEQYVGQQGLYDTGASGLYECEQMADSGCVLASIMIDRVAKTIKHYNYNIVGVINQADETNQKIVEEINRDLNQRLMDEVISKLNLKTGISRDQQDHFKKQIQKLYDKKFGKRPLVLLTVIYADAVDKAIDDINNE